MPVNTIDVNFEIYQKPLSGEYFRGTIKRYDDTFIVTCTTASGGNDKYSVLDLLDFNGKKKSKLIKKIKSFASKHKFIFKIVKPDCSK